MGDESEGGDCDEVICAGWGEPGGQWTEWCWRNEEGGSICAKQDRNDQRPIPHLSANTFHQRKRFVFVTFVWNYPRGPHVAAVTYLLARRLTTRSRILQRNYQVHW